MHADLSPEAVLGGFFAWVLCALGQDVGWPVPEGGSGQLTAALVARLRARGGEVVCDSPVDRIVIRDRRAVAVRTRGDEVRATRAVLADVAAPSLYPRSRRGRAPLGEGASTTCGRFEWDNATVKVDWNLDRPIPWSAEPARRAGTLHLADSVDALTESSSALARGLVPATPFLIMGQQSMTDPDAHAGRARRRCGRTRTCRARSAATRPASCASARPLDRSGLERFADRMQCEIEKLAPGFGEIVRGASRDGPRRSRGATTPTSSGGAIGAGTSQLYQQLVFRPVPGLGRPETPIRGLYLASASAHPGGGVHGACGANAARVAVAHDRVRRFVATARKAEPR